MERLTLKDCKRIWMTTDEDGKEVPIPDEDLAQLLPDWREEDCGGSISNKVTRKKAYTYFFYDYDENKYKQYRDPQGKISDTTYAVWGLIDMFNDGFIKSPAYVNWASYDIGFLHLIHNKGNLSFLMEELNSSQLCIDILKYLKSNIRAISKDLAKEMLPHISSLITDYTEKLKVEKAERKEAEKAQKKQEKQAKPKPEYILSLDEIVAYANEEAGENVGAIKAMLRYFKEEKDGWDNKTVKSIIQSIGKKSENNTTINVSAGAAFNDIHDNTNPTIH